MSTEDLQALPPAIKLPDANKLLNLGRSQGYHLAKTDQYPVKVLRVGKGYRVVTAELLKLLGLDDKQTPEPANT